MPGPSSTNVELKAYFDLSGTHAVVSREIIQ